MVAVELPPLATLDQLEAHIGRKLEGEERDQAEQWLRAASATIRRLTGQTLSYVEGDRELHDGWWSSLLQLRQLPVVEVHAVTVEGMEVAADGYSTAPNGWHLSGWRIDKETGNLWRSSGVWGGWAMWIAGRLGVEVIYDHGYKPLPDDLVQLACGMVGRAMAAPPGDVRSERLGPYSYDRGAIAGLGLVGLTNAESDVIAHYRVRRQVIQ